MLHSCFVKRPIFLINLARRTNHFAHRFSAQWRTNFPVTDLTAPLNPASAISLTLKGVHLPRGPTTRRHRWPLSRQNWTPFEIGPMGPLLTSKLDRGGSSSDACKQNRHQCRTCKQSHRKVRCGYAGRHTYAVVRLQSAIAYSVRVVDSYCIDGVRPRYETYAWRLVSRYNPADYNVL